MLDLVSCRRNLILYHTFYTFFSLYFLLMSTFATPERLAGPVSRTDMQFQSLLAAELNAVSSSPGQRGNPNISAAMFQLSNVGPDSTPDRASMPSTPPRTAVLFGTPPRPETAAGGTAGTGMCARPLHASPAHLCTPPSIRRAAAASAVAAAASYASPHMAGDSASRLHLSPAGQAVLGPARKRARPVVAAPFKVLDAPGLLDDFYLHLVDWSANNVVAVALGTVVYLWQAADGSVCQLGEPHDRDVAAVSWSLDGDLLAVSLMSGEVLVYRASTHECIWRARVHRGRAGVIAWSQDVLATAGKDGYVVLRKAASPDLLLARWRAHSADVVGMAWSPDERQLATGGNDNAVHVWDASRASSGHVSHTVSCEGHTAAVKALAWCPGTTDKLATAGGTHDQMVRVWNAHTGACLREWSAGAQVCALMWSAVDSTILTCHGFDTHDMALWDASTGECLAKLAGHSARIVYAAQSPTGDVVVTGGADEMLRFWRVFTPACRLASPAPGMASLLHLASMPDADCSATGVGATPPRRHAATHPDPRSSPLLSLTATAAAAAPMPKFGAGVIR